MTNWMKLAVLGYALAGAAGLGMAARYATADQFMTYHAIASGSQWELLTPGVQLILLALLKAAGAGFFATAVAAFMLIPPITRGDAWARWTSLATTCALLVPLLYVTLTLRAATGAPTPIVPAAVGLALVVVAFIAAQMDQHQRTRGRPPHNRDIGTGTR